jgi:TonB family protein
LQPDCVVDRDLFVSTYVERALAAAIFLTTLACSVTAAAQGGTAVKPPVVITHVDAIYPPSALATRKHANVVLGVTVDADGHVSKVEVIESGGADLDEAAMIAARQWTFRPAMREERAIASRIRVPFHFAPPEPPPEIVPSEPTFEHEVPSRPAVPAAPPKEDEIEEVQVTGPPPPLSYGASTFNFNRGALALVPNKNASELLRAAAPGLLLTNEGGEGHAEQVFLRGFDAREGQDLEFSVGGIPINESGNLHGNGYADTHFIIPELVESLRVVEGPFDPHQGNYAVAGSANYVLGLERRGLTAKYMGGSWNTHRLVLTWGPAQESRHTLAGAEIASTDGFGQNRDAVRASAMGQYEGRLGRRGSYRVFAQGYSTHYHSAGVLREDDFRARRIGFYDSYDVSSFARQQVPQGGDSARYSLGLDLETRAENALLSQQVFLIKRTMRLVENFTGFLLDVQTPLQSSHGQRGDTLDLNVDETTIGARGAARFAGKTAGLRQELELGYFARGDWTNGTQERLEAANGVPYKTENDIDAQLGDLGLFVDTSLRPLSWLNFRGGIRGDLFTFNVRDNCAAHEAAHLPRTNPPVDESCLTIQDFGRPREPDARASTASVALLPRGSVIAGPFDGFSFNVSYGLGARSIDPSYVTQDVKTPFARITAYETGVAYAAEVKKTEIVARSIFFKTDVDRDLIFSQTQGRNVLGVGTSRTGWVGALRLTGSFFDEAANLTLVRSAYEDTHLLVAYVPDVVFRSDTALFSALPLSIRGTKLKGTISSGITYVGPRALPFGQRSNDIFTVDGSATISWTNYEIGIIATNLFDQQYRLGEFNYASDFHSQPHPTLTPERHFTAGSPRGVFATFAINFGGV